MSANTELEYSSFNKRGRYRRALKKTSLHLITVKSAENAEELALNLFIPRFQRFPRFTNVFNINTSLIQIQNLIYDKLWNRCTSGVVNMSTNDIIKPIFGR